MKLILLCTLLALAGCGTLFVPAPDPEPEPLVLNPSIQGKASAALDVWCGNLTNLRRIALRLIHVLDPEWRSVCEARAE